MISSGVQRREQGTRARGDRLQPGAETHGMAKVKVILPNLTNCSSSFPNGQCTSFSPLAVDFPTTSLTRKCNVFSSLLSLGTHKSRIHTKAKLSWAEKLEEAVECAGQSKVR